MKPKLPWHVKLIQKFFSLRFTLARWTRIPLIGRLTQSLLFKGDRLYYLPPTKVISLKKPLDNSSPLSNLVLPGRIVEYFIEQAQYYWIMNRCICRESNQCEDYPIDLGCLFLGEAVLQIDSRLGRLVTREEAFEHVRKCRQAGLVHLIGRNKLDSVWLKARPMEKLLTICNCCPCCCLWKMLPDLTPAISQGVSKLPGVTVYVTEKCTGCGRCTNSICFVNAIQLEDNRARISEQCRGCGRCVQVCPHNAIQLDYDLTETDIQNIIEDISQLVEIR